MKKIIIVGAGFAGLNAAVKLGNVPGLEVTVIDRKNHHLFQPLLYQVATAGLSPADIAKPIRNLLSRYRNITVLQGAVTDVDKDARIAVTDFGKFEYDYLILACGSHHAYFGHDEWEENAPGLKTLAQATEIRGRILNAFENAERENDPKEREKNLTYVIVGGGPTGVELAGAIAETSRFTLAEDFRHIDPQATRILLIEAGPRILPTFSEKLSLWATEQLKDLGVDVRVNTFVSNVDSSGVVASEQQINAATVLWAAGVKASSLGKRLNFPIDKQGRIIVESDLSISGYPNIMVAGDQAHFAHDRTQPLPGMAPAALQQGRFIAENIIREIAGRPRSSFKYVDKGQMATIGRNKAIAEFGRLKLHGFTAWVLWLIVHIYYLTGFRNRLFVTLQWGLSYVSFRKGARLIVRKEWRSYS